jgi:hypothetical protein
MPGPLFFAFSHHEAETPTCQHWAEPHPTKLPEEWDFTNTDFELLFQDFRNDAP